jgi:hypothetical protein
MTTNQSNLAKQLVSAIVHTANYLKHSTERLRSLEGNLTGVEDQLSDIQDTLGELTAAAQSFIYGTPEYWQQQRVEFFKVALTQTLQLEAKHEAILLAGKYADDALAILRAQEDTKANQEEVDYLPFINQSLSERYPVQNTFNLYNTYSELISEVADPDCYMYSNGLLSDAN